MPLTTDIENRTVAFELPRAVYSRDALKIANAVFSSRCEVYLAEGRKGFAVTLRSRRREASASDLEALGGDFLNELLNQEYRFIVGRFNESISRLIVTQALYAARGGEKSPKPPAEPAGFKAEVAELMRQAEEEVARTMPKKIADQGAPLPPAPEGSLA